MVRSKRTVALAVTILAIALAVAGCSGGGCPWKDASAVTIQPATACLSASVLNWSADDNGGFHGGCVAPDVRVTNACSDSLVVPGVVQLTADANSVDTGDAGAAFDGGGVATIVSGATGAFEVNLPSSENVSLPATLGGQSVTLSFTLTRQ